MGKSHHRLFYHAVWTPYLRQPLISPEIEEILYPFIGRRAKRDDCTVLAVNGMEEHIHVVFRLTPAHAVSTVIGAMKGSSSYHLNHEVQVTSNFSWQDGYSVYSVSEKNLPDVIRYVNNQKEHHRLGTVIPKWEYVPEPECPGQPSADSNDPRAKHASPYTATLQHPKAS